ncbi:MAG: PDZ domain-containing protein [Patescibacteria group bacterium]|jgi:hypothetical protein
MEPRISPTSVKRKNEFSARGSGIFSRPGGAPLVIGISVVTGCIAGCIGAFALMYFSGSAFFQNGQNSTPYFFSGINRRNTYQSAIREVVDNRLSTAYVALYRVIDEKDLVTSLSAPDAFLGWGMMMTRDGYAVTTVELPSDISVYAKVAEHQPQRVEIQDRSLATGLTFIKVNEQGLDIASFSSTPLIQLIGQEVAQVQLRRLGSVPGVDIAQVIGIGTEQSETDAIVRSTEGQEKFLLLGATVLSDRGAPILDSARNVVGSVAESSNGTTKVIPWTTIKNTLDKFLQNKTLAQPYVGLTYIDLSEDTALPEMLAVKEKNGIYVVTVSVRSPAEKSTLQAGDIITAVDGQTLDARLTFTDVLQQHIPGDTVICEVRRGADRLVLNLILGEKP